MYTYQYPHPAVTADMVVFGFDGCNLHVLLIERGLEPHKGSWALPGGFMNIDETIEQCAARELREETGLWDILLEQFHVFSEVNRDPRERIITVAFLTLVHKSDFKVAAGDDAANINWFPLDKLPPIAFDHLEIIRMACKKLREYKKKSSELIDPFSIRELNRIFEVIDKIIAGF